MLRGILWLIFLGIICTILAIPKILNTDSGRKFLINQANRHFQGAFYLDELNLSWLGPQSLKGLTLFDSSHQELLHFDELKVPASLWQLWKHSPIPGILIQNLSLLEGDKVRDIELSYSGTALSLNHSLEITIPFIPLKKIASPFFPFLSSILSSENPILLNIDSENFVLPYPWDLAKASLHGRLEAGPFKLSSDHPFSHLLNFSSKDRPISTRLQMTPLYFEMIEGKAKIERMDLLAETHPLALWGQIDLLQEALNLKVAILELEPPFIFPIKGTYESISVETTDLISQIAAAFAHNYLPQIHLSVTETIPPQTTIPLPWTIHKIHPPKLSPSKIKDAAEGFIKDILKKKKKKNKT